MIVLSRWHLLLFLQVVIVVNEKIGRGHNKNYDSTTGSKQDEQADDVGHSADGPRPKRPHRINICGQICQLSPIPSRKSLVNQSRI